ncbi:phospholipase C/P1 nuclease domain-containing protein [Entophlyctis helioformis]|nr:phospholipase C/P1 nuclease domain-containing protein [Entophlyctis helioformis]
MQNMLSMPRPTTTTTRIRPSSLLQLAVLGTLWLQSASLLLPAVHAYGATGHWLSGRIAQYLLTPEAAELAKKLLPNDNGDLAKVASWADVIKSNPRYRWTSRLHYINPVGDNPPTLCKYAQVPEDCPNNQCVVGAIYNFTAILVAGSSATTAGPDEQASAAAAALHVQGAGADDALDLAASAGRVYPPHSPSAPPNRDVDPRTEALKFVIHFLGDLHQPLHATGRDRGGNDAKVSFNGRQTSLHAVWDTSMFEKRIRNNFGGNKETFAKFLVNEIITTWKDEIRQWTDCSTSPSPAPSPASGVESSSSSSSSSPSSVWPSLSHASLGAVLPVCPEKWARYANIVNCVHVWPEYKRKFDMSGKYYEKNILVAEKMLAQSGVRIAALLGAISSLPGGGGGVGRSSDVSALLTPVVAPQKNDLVLSLLSLDRAREYVGDAYNGDDSASSTGHAASHRADLDKAASSWTDRVMQLMVGW